MGQRHSPNPLTGRGSIVWRGLSGPMSDESIGGRTQSPHFGNIFKKTKPENIL